MTEEEWYKYITLDDNVTIIDIDGYGHTTMADLYKHQGFPQYSFFRMISKLRKEHNSTYICNKISIMSIDNHIVKLKFGWLNGYKIQNGGGDSLFAFSGYEMEYRLEYKGVMKVDIKDNPFLIEYIKEFGNSINI